MNYHDNFCIMIIAQYIIIAIVINEQIMRHNNQTRDIISMIIQLINS